MPVAPLWPTIPVPTEDLKSLNASVLALKQVAEMLTGQDQMQKFAPHTFVQADTPVALHDGDFWLCTGKTYSFNIWDGNKWLKIADLP